MVLSRSNKNNYYITQLTNCTTTQLLSLHGNGSYKGTYLELNKVKKVKSELLRVSLVLFGMISFGLGVLGIFLPLLPTTPFMLLSAFLFIRSSDRLYRWLINHRLFGKYIYDYIERRSIPRRVKWYTLGLLWASILTSVATLDVGNVIRLMLLLIAVGVTLHVVKLRNG